eukprot:6818244-Lingulodinium_polyedra.AAC.1
MAVCLVYAMAVAFEGRQVSCENERYARQLCERVSTQCDSSKYVCARATTVLLSKVLNKAAKSSKR